MSTQELKTILVPWIKDVENTEWNYCYYVDENMSTKVVKIIQSYVWIVNKMFGGRKYDLPL